MATSPARKKPAPPKTTKPAAAKKRAGFVAPETPAIKGAPKKATTPPKKPRTKAPARTPAKGRTKATAPQGLPTTEEAPVAPAIALDGRAVLASLSDKARRFVDEYLIDLNGTQAAVRAGYSVATARQIASENLSKPDIQAAIAAARQAQQERTQIDADRVVKGLWSIFTADPRELVQVKVGCCRHCWGEGHKRQRTLSEYNSDRARHREGGKPDEDWEEEGGIGYDPLRDPHSRCPECHGDGHARTVLGDTRYLSPETAALYAGARNGKHGIEVLTHSKMDAAEKLMKHLGMYEKDNQQKTDPLASLLHAIGNGNGNGFKPLALDPEKPQTAAKPSAFTPRPDDERD